MELLRFILGIDAYCFSALHFLTGPINKKRTEPITGTKIITKTHINFVTFSIALFGNKLISAIIGKTAITKEKTVQKNIPATGDNRSITDNVTLNVLTNNDY